MSAVVQEESSEHQSGGDRKTRSLGQSVAAYRIDAQLFWRRITIFETLWSKAGQQTDQPTIQQKDGWTDIVLLSQLKHMMTHFLYKIKEELRKLIV